MTRIEVEGGKYTVVHENGANLHALRHGEPWRDLCGDGLVLAMAQEIENLRDLASQPAKQQPLTLEQCGESSKPMDSSANLREGSDG